MPFLMELVLAGAALYIAGRAIFASFRATQGPWSRFMHRLLAAALPLGAVLAGWVLTYLLWHPLTGHHSHGYPVWFWAPLFAVACVAALVTLVTRGAVSGLAHMVELGLCVALLIVEAFHVDWFGPSWADWHYSAGTWAWGILFLVLLVAALIVALAGAVVWAIIVALVAIVGLLLTGLNADDFAHHNGTTGSGAAATKQLSSSIVATNTGDRTVNFDGSRSTGATSYAWTFRVYNGSDPSKGAVVGTANTVWVNKTFAKDGTYAAALQVSDGEHSAVTYVTVAVSENLPYTQKSPGDCVDGFNVKYDPNKGLDDVTGGIDTSNPAKARNQILDVAHHDPRYLFKLVEASPLGHDRFPQLTSYSQLQDAKTGNGCYSVLGRDVYNTYQGVLYNTKTKLTSLKQAPAFGSNSGTNPKGSPFMEPPGKLTGDRRALQITYPGGQKADVLHRCGNVFVPGRTPVPHVPVKPPAHHKPPHHGVCKLPTKRGYNIVNCHYVKPPQTWECQQNGGPKCPPNPAHQPPQSPGNHVQSTATNPVPGVSNEPKPLPSGPGGTHAPPTKPNKSGYNPGPSGAPGGGAGNGGSTTVRAPKPNPTPSQAVPTSDPVNSGSPSQPG